MKKIGSLIGLTLLIASCSSPKYTYNFDHYDYHSGKKKNIQNDQVAAASESPLTLNEETLVASSSEKPVVLAEERSAQSPEQVKNDFAKKYNAMSKAERKEFRDDLKKELKAYAKAKKEGKSVTSTNATTEQLDHDLKLAILFGAVGLVLTLFGGVSSVFWVLGVIGIVIGVVFLVKWLMRQ